MDDVLAVAGQERLDAVDQFLRGEGQGQDRVGDVFVHFHVRGDDQDDGQFGIFFAQGQADAHAAAPQGGGVNHRQVGRDLVEAFGGFPAALDERNFKSLLLQFGRKRRDFGMSSLD